ncbi:MAG TPA: RNA methyltransferase [Candidatus Cloacimonadota bacterium]|nr:RNA methyltransferase [Candidatus Cloacimonadota bacterium]
MKNNLYVGLVHYPVHNKFGEVVTTSITNLDIHDISRSCVTFGVKKFFIINPLESQKQMYERITNFWKTEIAQRYNPDRVNALSVIDYAFDIESVQQKINSQEEGCLTITTTAMKLEHQIVESDLAGFDKPILLLFGTGNGLASQVHELADYVLAPIKGKGNYNHLSVRSAVAIYLDRLTSDK